MLSNGLAPGFDCCCGMLLHNVTYGFPTFSSSVACCGFAAVLPLLLRFLYSFATVVSHFYWYFLKVCHKSKTYLDAFFRKAPSPPKNTNAFSERAKTLPTTKKNWKNKWWNRIPNYVTWVKNPIPYIIIHYEYIFCILLALYLTSHGLSSFCPPSRTTPFFKS